jgi:hypothetical protein
MKLCKKRFFGEKNDIVNIQQRAGSISPTFYAQLLCAQFPKAQKWQSSYQCLFALLGSAHTKKLLVKRWRNRTRVVKWRINFSFVRPIGDNCYPMQQSLSLSEYFFYQLLKKTNWKSMVEVGSWVPVFTYRNSFH